MSESRVHCCIPECRRSFKKTVDDETADHAHNEIMCGRCYRTAEPHLVEHHKRVHRRMRRATRLLRLKSVQSKKELSFQIEHLDELFRRACARSWAAIKTDVEMKSNMRLEGTAGALAARRRA